MEILPWRFGMEPQSPGRYHTVSNLYDSYLIEINTYASAFANRRP